MAMSQLRKRRAFREERMGLKVERRMGSTRTVCALELVIDVDGPVYFE